MCICVCVGGQVSVQETTTTERWGVEGRGGGEEADRNGPQKKEHWKEKGELLESCL